MTVIRRPGLASVAALGGITAALAAAPAAAPGWVRAAGLDLWNLPAAEADYRASIDRRGELKATHDRLHRQFEASDQTVELLIDGRLSLAAAAGELDQINRDRAGFYASLRFHHAEAGSDLELAAWYAIDKVRRRLANDPARLAGVMARLDAELRALSAPPGRNVECPANAPPMTK
jgi:hypothetical protein